MFQRFNFLRIFSNKDICFTSVPLVLTKIASIKALACGNSFEMDFITHGTRPALMLIRKIPSETGTFRSIAHPPVRTYNVRSFLR